MASDSPILDDEWARRVSAGVASGSRDALESLYRARYERLFRLVRARTRRDDAFVVDCVHDAWLRAARHMRPVGSLDELDRWLARAAISAAIDRLRVDASRRRREETEPLPSAPAADELIETMRDELGQLSETDRSAIDLRFRRGLSLDMLAAVLGIGVKAAEIRLRRAVGRLRGRVEAASQDGRRGAP